MEKRLCPGDRRPGTGATSTQPTDCCKLEPGMELLLIFLLKLSSCLALVQTNLGLGLGLVRKSETLGYEHHQLVRFAQEVEHTTEKFKSEFEQATTPTPLYYGDTFNPLVQVT